MLLNSCRDNIFNCVLHVAMKSCFLLKIEICSLFTCGSSLPSLPRVHNCWICCWSPQSKNNPSIFQKVAFPFSLSSLFQKPTRKTPDSKNLAFFILILNSILLFYFSQTKWWMPNFATNVKLITMWKASIYRVFLGPHFLVFELNTDTYRSGHF